MMKKTMLFGQKLLLYCILLLVMAVAVDIEDPPPNRLRINAQLVDTTSIRYGLQLETPIFEDNENKVLDLFFYLDSAQHDSGERTICICMQTNDALTNANEPTLYCSGYSRICFQKNWCFGKNKDQIKYFELNEISLRDIPRTYYKLHIIIKDGKATIKQTNDNDVVLDIAPFSLNSALQLKRLSIGLIAFFENVNSADCTDEKNANCHHADLLYLRTTSNQPLPQPLNTTAATSEQPTTTNETSTTPPPSTSTTEKTATGSLTALYVCIGVVVAIVILIILLCVLRCYQGMWCCGICCFKKDNSEDERKKKYKLTRSDEADKKRGSGDKGDGGPQEPSIMQGLTTDQINRQMMNRSKEMKITFEDMLDSTQSLQATAEEQLKLQQLQQQKAAAAHKKKKDEKTSQSSSSSAAADTKENKEKDKPGKRRAQAPNMLLVATREEDTQSEGEKIPSRRKTKVDKNNKEPAATKNVTQDPGAAAAGTTTGKAATKTGGKKTEAQTGIPKSETDLATDKDGLAAAATKGVSATQADKVTETYETRPTQRGTTMATGAAKATTLPPTQLGTQTTQGGATTAAGARKTKTGIGKTAPRVTGPTQMPSTEDTNETQLPTGTTKTKPTQLQTGATKTKATQLATGATQKASTGTTQAGTGTTQRGTTMATGKTQMGTTAATQARTGTRQTGETQNPDDTDIDYTQVGGTGGATRGGTRPTQLPSDADADPTQNPTALTGGEGGRTSKTQLAATGAKTRTTQQQTKKTDAL